ncbi:MAG: hypothetical protein H7Y00_13230 [Fimbriimonadaceae bacterium]|nr:hypothetical protein [Chitinophagales bacterium]
MKHCIVGLCMMYFSVAVAQKCDSVLNLINYTPTISGIYNPVWNYNNALENFTISAYGDIYTGSNSITTTFLKNIYNSGFIDDTMKNTVSENLESINRVGVNIFSGVGFTLYNKKIFKGKAAITGGIEHVVQQTADFTPDVFHLIFYGNYDLQDSIARLSNTTFNGIKYNKYRFGIIKPIPMSDGIITASAMLGVVQGQSTNFININNGAFYTAPYGEYIDFTYDFVVKNTAPDSGFFDWQGAGASLDLFFEYNWTNIDLKLSFIATDVGFIKWYSDTKKLTADTSIFFEGVEVDDLLNATGSVFTQDTIYDLLGLKETELAFSTALPIKLNTAIVKEFNPTFYAALGVQHIINSTYVPLVYLKSGKIFTKTGTAVDGIIEYGGYGGLSFGVGATQRITKNASIQINASNFLGLIVPDKLTGAAGYIVLHTAF